MDRRPPAYQLRILAQCSLEQPFSSPAEVDITKGQGTKSGARSERVCLST